MANSVLICVALAIMASLGYAQNSPFADTSLTIGDKTITIRYSAPSVRGRKIFGDGGLISHDPTYPVWRAGANAATALHTDADLDIQGLRVPAGDYTLFVNLADPDHWELIVSKDTKEWGLAYKKDMDLGRVKMKMSKPPAPVEVYKMTLPSTGGHSGKLRLEWENHIASVSFTMKRMTP
ncbi:MAG TPA: DUF2911 domain-containing protein [Bryobacteraceae bacterium]|jgi:hypothetical protein|nr:DUF2911 domain-containing protein [Bryobacteraceae bacterium]